MQVLSIIFLIFLFSCREANRTSDKEIGYRDSLVAEYLALQDSIRWFDTANPMRDFLLAYNKNDTNYLKESIKTVQDAVLRSKMPSPTFCSTPKAINSFGFEEAYRFEYMAAFCDQAINLTVGHRNQTTQITAYHYTFDYLKDSCLSYKIIERTIPKSQWDSISADLKYADLWGLKERIYQVGFDGSSLRVTGFIKPTNEFEGRYTQVSRWSAEKSALGQAFKHVLDISGISVNCFHY